MPFTSIPDEELLAYYGVPPTVNMPPQATDALRQQQSLLPANSPARVGPIVTVDPLPRHARTPDYGSIVNDAMNEAGIPDPAPTSRRMVQAMKTGPDNINSGLTTNPDGSVTVDDSGTDRPPAKDPRTTNATTGEKSTFGTPGKAQYWDTDGDFQPDDYTSIKPNRNSVAMTPDGIDMDPQPGEPEPAPTTPTTPTAPTIDMDARRAYSNRIGQAYDSAIGYGSNRLKALGYSDGTSNDPYGIMDLYSSEIGRRRSAINDMEADPDIIWNDSGADPSSYFTGYEDVFNSVIGDRRSAERRTRRNQFDTAFGDTGEFASTLLPDTYDDTYIENLLNPQYTDALGQLDRAKGRGILSEGGYSTALKGLNDARGKAQREVGLYGQSLLNTGRSNVSSLLNTERSRLNDWDFGDSFDTNAVRERANRSGQNYGATIEGSLANNYAGRNFFDPTSLISDAKRNQAGATGGGGSPLIDTMREEELRRGKGTAGAF